MSCSHVQEVRCTLLSAKHLDDAVLDSTRCGGSDRADAEAVTVIFALVDPCRRKSLLHLNNKRRLVNQRQSEQRGRAEPL